MWDLSQHSSAFTARETSHFCQSVDVCLSTDLSARQIFHTLWSRNIYMYISHTHMRTQYIKIYMYLYTYMQKMYMRHLILFWFSPVFRCFLWPPFVSFPRFGWNLLWTSLLGWVVSCPRRTAVWDASNGNARRASFWVLGEGNWHRYVA